jgi:hypothetical protein
MTLKRYAAKRDGNEPNIIRCLRKCGVLVQPLSLPGMPDLLVCYRGRLMLLEVKNTHGKLNPAQRKVALQGWPITTVYSIAEALALIGVENSQ